MLASTKRGKSKLRTRPVNKIALRAAGELLRERELGLTWCGDEDLGFPKTYPAFLPAAAHSKIERLIEREVEKASRSQRRKPRRR